MEEKRIIGELATLTLKELYWLWESWDQGAEHELHMPNVARCFMLLERDGSGKAIQWLRDTLDMPIEDLVDG